MYAKHSESVINASLCPQLELYSYGEVKLRAGETWGDDVESHVAITGKDIIFKGNTFNVIGGNGVNKSANEAICGVGGSYSTLIFAAEVVNIVGGRGQSGKQGVQGKNSSSPSGQGSRGEVGEGGSGGPAGASCKNYNGTKTHTANPGLSYDEWIRS